MTDGIIVAVLLAIVGGAVLYIIKAKRNGVKCIGCPSGGSCSGHCSSNNGKTVCSCGCAADTKGN